MRIDPNMLAPNLIIFYVKNPLESSEFYTKIFKIKPVQAFPTWASFSFPNGLHFALWSTKAKDFVSEGTGSRSELCFLVSDEQEVRRLREEWGHLGVKIEQDLFKAVFGLNFVALDPDGHRIRVCIPD